MKIKKGDKVKVMAGKDKGKEALVQSVVLKTNKVVVEGVNIVKKHLKPGKVTKEGGIQSIEKPIDVSNVMVICGNCNKTTRVSYKIEENKKYRVCRKCGNTL